MKKQFLTIALVIYGISVYAQITADTDPLPVANGIVITSLSAADDEAYDMALQSDGKIILTGYSNTNFALVRYLANGTLDPSFGSGGVVKTALHCVNPITSAIA